MILQALRPTLIEKLYAKELAQLHDDAWLRTQLRMVPVAVACMWCEREFYPNLDKCLCDDCVKEAMTSNEPPAQG